MAVSHGVRDELVCSICLDTFRVPVLLPCAHSFCKQCLTNVHERSRIRNTQYSGGPSRQSAGTPTPETSSVNDHATSLPPNINDRPIVCPQCRREFHLGPEGIDGLPRNTSLANIILSIEEEKRAKNVVCEVCDYEPARSASKTCADCAVTYCTPCFQQLHPLRGAFKYHLIKDANVRSQVSFTFVDYRSPRPSVDGYGTDGDSGDEGGTYANPDILEKVRRQIKSKRKELNNVMKAVQGHLKTTEEETEERMREIRSVCGRINETVGEKEAGLLTIVSTQRHEAVKQCLALTSDVKFQSQSLDLLEDQVNDIIALTAVHSGTDVSNDIAAIQERVTAIHSRALVQRAKLIPKQPKLGEVVVEEYVNSLEFVKDAKLLSLYMTDVIHRPVINGPALVEVKWRGLDNIKDVQLSAKSKDPRGFEVITSVTLGASLTSYLLALPCVNAEYTLILEATAESGAKYPPIQRVIRTMPYVYCFKARFNPATCHKRIAVSSGRDEVVHRKCKIANLQSACAVTTSFQRLEKLEGAMADECLPILPFVYWEAIVHFQVYGKLGNSKLLCDIGVCKQGMEDASNLLCDNQKSYCAYLVRRNNTIALEFWNGPNRDPLPRSIPVLDLIRSEREKSLRLGFYYDAMKRVLAIISPGNNTILAQFYVKSTNLVPTCGLYCFEQVFTMVKFSEPQKLPTVLCKLMKWSHGN